MNRNIYIIAVICYLLRYITVKPVHTEVKQLIAQHHNMNGNLGNDDYFVNHTKDSLHLWIHNSASYTGNGVSIGNEIFIYVTLITATLLLLHR